MNATAGFSRELTEVGDPDGHALVEDVEDHDDHEADEGSGDGGGHLGGDVVLQGLQLLQVVGVESGREGEEGGQAVDSDGHDGSQDQQDLRDERKTKREVNHPGRWRIPNSHWCPQPILKGPSTAGTNVQPGRRRPPGVLYASFYLPGETENLDGPLAFKGQVLDTLEALR